MGNTRRATHANSWYNGNGTYNSQFTFCNDFTIGLGQVLDEQLDGWLGAVEASNRFSPPIKGCKAIIGPRVSLSDFIHPSTHRIMLVTRDTRILALMRRGPTKASTLPECT